MDRPLVHDALDDHPGAARRGGELAEVDRGPEPGGMALALGRATERRPRAGQRAAGGGERAVQLGLVGNPDRGPAAGAEDAPDLADVPERDPRVGDVVEDDERDADVGAFVPDAGEALPVAVEPLDAVEPGVQPAGALEHRRRDVDPPDGGAALGQRPRDPADAAADVDRFGVLDELDSERLLDHRERLVATGPEALQVGRAVVEPVVDEEERVLVGAGVPKVLH